MTFLAAALISSNVVSSWELYLLYRQRIAHRTSVIPPSFTKSVTQESFDKTQAYSRDKISFSMICSVKSIVESTLSLKFLPSLWYGVEEVVKKYVSPGVVTGSFLHSYAFALFGEVVSTLIDLPLSYYQTFVLEAKHGFNKSTRTEFLKDKVKGFLLRAVVFHPVTVGLVNFVVSTFGAKFPMYLFGGASLLITAATFLFPVLIQPLFNTFKPLPEESSLKKEVDALAKKLAFPLSKVLEVDGSRRSAHSNAYFYGFFNNKRIVLYDTLLQQMTETQILAVLCHEFGHWKHSHTTKMFVTGLVQLYAFCYGAKHAMFNEGLFADFGFKRGDMSPTIGLELFTVVFCGPITTLLGYIMSIISRQFEFQADRFAVEMGYGKELIESLLVLQSENKASITPDWLFATLHYSHPPLVERLAALEFEFEKHRKKAQ